MKTKRKTDISQILGKSPEIKQAILAMGDETRKKRKTDRQFQSAMREIQNLIRKNK